MLKKYLGCILAVVLSMTMSVTAFAASSDKTIVECNEYVQLVKAGVLAEDITFEYWKQLKEASYTLEKTLEASDEFTLVYDSTDIRATYASYSLTKGDVFITNGTSSAGILGHAGIAISDNSILHIAGPNCHPTTISLSDWNSDYTTEGWTKVYRHYNDDVADRAGQWAADNYEGSDAEYVISMNLVSTNETYCSKLVWQAYYYGPEEPSANGPTWGVRLPYDLPDTIYGLSLVKTYEET